MKVHDFALYSTIFLYSLLYDTRFLMIYGGIMVMYMIFGWMQPNSKYNTTRKKIMIGSWDEPREGNVLANMEIDMTDVVKNLEKYK